MTESYKEILARTDEKEKILEFISNTSQSIGESERIRQIIAKISAYEYGLIDLQKFIDDDNENIIVKNHARIAMRHAWFS